MLSDLTLIVSSTVVLTSTKDFQGLTETRFPFPTHVLSFPTEPASS